MKSNYQSCKPFKPGTEKLMSFFWLTLSASFIAYCYILHLWHKACVKFGIHDEGKSLYEPVDTDEAKPNNVYDLDTDDIDSITGKWDNDKLGAA